MTKVEEEASELRAWGPWCRCWPGSPRRSARSPCLSSSPPPPWSPRCWLRWWLRAWGCWRRGRPPRSRSQSQIRRCRGLSWQGQGQPQLDFSSQSPPSGSLPFRLKVYKLREKEPQRKKSRLLSLKPDSRESATQSTMWLYVNWRYVLINYNANILLKNNI